MTAVWLLTLALAAEADVAPPKFRLPATARPLAYAVALTILPEKEDFSGAVEIELELTQAQKVLWLNATELAIARAELVGVGRGRVVPGGDDFVGFSFGRAVGPGRARLRVEYSGRISTKDTTGIFRQKVGEDWYAFTQFQAIDARRAFPCFDEPGYKVPWRVTLRVKPGDLAFSNAPVAGETAAGGQKAVAFAETKPLPSYLIAFGVGPFEVVDAGKAGLKPTPIRIIVPKGRAAEARHAAATAGPILVELEKYFGTPFPFEKLDNLVIPETVRFGAMENAGLVTYNQQILLARPEQETPSFQRIWALVYAHETAHQWFGDLVTLAWWDDTWLNESFATWMASRTLEQWKPDWAEEVERVQDRSRALEDDSLASARAIRLAVDSKDDIDNAFDNISYGKGAAVIGMFESWTGPEAFQRGVRRFLADHAWGSATERDFRAALEAEGGAGVAQAFATFLDRPGYPLLALELRCGEGGPRLVLSQERFRPAGAPETPPALWRVPVCVRYDAGRGAGRACRWLAEPKAEMPLPEAAACPAWVVGNAGGVGYYRVRYGGELLGKLLGPPLTLPEKVALVRDVAAVTAAGRMPAADALAMVPLLAREDDRHLLTATVRIVRDLDEMVPEGRRAHYARFARSAFGERARRLGWNPQPGEGEDAALLRPRLVGFVADGGEDAELRAQAKALALRWLDDKKAVGPDTLGPVLRVAAEEGDRSLFERFRAEAKRNTSRRERRALFGALGGFRDPATLTAALAVTLSDEFDAREAIDALWSALGDRDGRAMGWDFFRANYDALVARLPREAGGLLPYAGAGFCDSTRRAEVESFFRDRVDTLTGAKRTLAQVLERIDLCQAAAAVQRPSLSAFLADR